MDFELIKFIFKVSRPFELLGGVLVYALGVSIARYLGIPIDWAMVLLGQIWVTAYQLASHFLEAYFHHPIMPRNPTRFLLSSSNDKPSEGIRRDVILWLSLTAFTAIASLSLVFSVAGNVNLAGLLLMGLMLVGSILYSVPPFKLIYTGYGELLQSIILASLIPGLGFVMQSGEIHRILAMSTFPLVMLHLAMTIAHQYQNFGEDSRVQNKTILVRLGWERGISLHNFLVLGSYLLMGLAMLFGLPMPIAIATYAVLPLGIFQIWYLTRIGSGAKPNWRALNITAVLTFSLTVYLLLFRFLTH